MTPLKPAALILALTLPISTSAQTVPQASEPPSAIEQAIEGLLSNLFERFRPHLDGMTREMEDTMNDFAPALEDLTGLMDDIGNYNPPERLANGDIIIRRKEGAPPPPAMEELRRILPLDPNGNLIPQAPEDAPQLNPNIGGDSGAGAVEL